MTPSRKIKALLAQFDDSDSDRSRTTKNATRARPAVQSTVVSSKKTENGPDKDPTSPAEGGVSSDEAIQEGPRGRLASRMEAPVNPTRSESPDDDSGANAYARIKDQIAQLSKPTTAVSESIINESSEDELLHQIPRTRLLQKKLTTQEHRVPREETRSPSPLFFPSPSAERPLSSSPLRHSSQPAADSDELAGGFRRQKGSKFLALVEKHRKQRLAREAADEAKRAERLEQLKDVGSKGSTYVGAAMADGLTDESDLSDGAGKKLTQQARPTRKATKKAIEEISRETQRMSRSMQLAHQAKTKKKITKESFLARFNLINRESGAGQSAEKGDASATASSPPVSDVEQIDEHMTPPTSPLPSEEGQKPATDAQVPSVKVDASLAMEDKEPLEIQDVLASEPGNVLEDGLSVVTSVDTMNETARQPIVTSTKSRVRPIRVRWSKQDAVVARGADSDSDLEIVTSKSRSKKIAAFESLQRPHARETSSHLILRSLAHVQTGATNGQHATMNAAQMEAHLRRAARMQAIKEREEKLEQLRSRGVLVQTAEEREKELQEVEDLVEQARVEGAEIQRREKEIAKKDGTFIKDQFDDDDESDEDDADFQDVDEEVDDHLSGSEEEGQGSELDDEDGIESKKEFLEGHAFDMENSGSVELEADNAQSDDESHGVATEDEVGEPSEKENRPPRRPVRGRHLLVLSDDDDEEEHDAQNPSPPQDAKTPQSLLRSARKVIPGLQMSDDLPIGLTQAFAATMADSGSESEGVDPQEQDSLALTRDLPSPQFKVVPSLNRLESLDIITDSQPATQTQPLNLDLSLLPTQGVPESPAALSSTQFSFVPTQDVGYVMSPFKESRFDTPIKPPHSTIDTVILSQEEQSPILQRKGRLRRGRAAADSDDEVVEAGNDGTGFGPDNSAFAVMQKVAKTRSHQEGFDKAKSHAKEVVDEAAEESEDEYAGLGGASDDEDGEEDEADRKMIDQDEKLGQGDEGKLAGFYA